MTALPGRILLVEDEPLIARATARLLHRRLGAEVVVVHDGAVALETVRRDDGFDGAVVDLQLPGMNGDRLVSALATIAPHIPCGLWSSSPALHRVHTAPTAFRLPKTAPVDQFLEGVRAMLLAPTALELRSIEGRGTLPPTE
ncbi:MAG TPA: response regulator [Sandaracinaceae bacterium LLY-WYZ-13_1]|nr:response regulator [Sandaracinaceae bacterium LLY-WYZ-13_1]